MGQPKRIKAPLTEADVRSLRAGEEVLVNGVVFAARDVAHKRLSGAIKGKKKLPFEVSGTVIYFAGPTPPRPGRPIGAAGPTTSSRMDGFSPSLYAKGVKATIGKGYRSSKVREALQQYGAVHLSTIGGAGALLGKRVRAAEVVAYKDLGSEAIRRLEVEDFPAVVAYDCYGGSVYEQGARD